MQKKSLVVAKIIKPQGVKGNIKIQSFTDDSDRFKLLKTVFIDQIPHAVEEVSFAGGFVVLKLSGITDRNMAESFRDKLICIDKKDAIDPQDGYFIVDLIGAKVLDEKNNTLGTIYDINSFGSADVIECKNFRFPFLDHVVKTVDVEKKEFVVIKKYFDEVVVCDN